MASRPVTDPFALEPGGTNAIGRMLAVLGDEWSLLIIRESLLGATKYSDFSRLPISHAVLTARLRSLVRDGLLVQQVYQQQPLRAGYLPSAECRRLWTVLLSIWHWERTWVDRADELPLMRHRDCGEEFAPMLCCAQCQAPTEALDIDARWGPSGGWARSVPRATTRRRLRSDDQPGMFPQTMAVFGNRWSAAILGAAFLGTRRFNDFQSRLSAPAPLIAERLKVFCDIGILQAAAHPKRSDWSEYHLTPKGLAFYPVVATAIGWAHTTYHGDEGPALVQTHRRCGAEFSPLLVCDQCHKPLTGTAVEIVPPRGEAVARRG
ncbi:MAG: helix-turn-helix transcriptional regulator [Mycolicibacterium hassiacum]|uniref:winged helix-turn-helix transcriptional regulator n=1 Tax=Mycolicibacterium hassiacum TaxID=46351 RepID=UPI0023FA1A87|nr:winged helix-turn-helix transcriptional regulator [Mycolicibacterium hassiacum]MBX5487236.1 helix-turn-helix transcriptional regulator [Mycolicibacterium hassiacum]